MTNKLPKKQMELLMLIWPIPIGKGLMINKAAILLGIKAQTAYSRLKYLKEYYPEAYNKLREAQKEVTERRKQWHRQIPGCNSSIPTVGSLHDITKLADSIGITNDYMDME